MSEAANSSQPNTVQVPSPSEGAPSNQVGTPTNAQAAQKATQQRAAEEAAARIMRLKMDGMDIDLPEAEVIKLAQQAGVSSKRFQEAAALKKQTEQILAYINQNPGEALEKLVGPQKAREIYEKRLMEFIKRDAETPEAKKARELEEKVRDYERREREGAELRKRQEIQALEAKRNQEREAKTREYAQQFDKLFTEALTKENLPKTAYTVSRMAALQRVNLKKGFELSADQLAKIVRQDYDSEMNHFMGGMDGEQLLNFLGDPVTGKVSKALVKRLKGANVQKFATPSPTTPSEPVQKSTAKTWRDFQKRKRSL